MTEREAFEPRLHDEVHRYAERVTTEIDAAAFAHAVATGAPRGRGLASLLGWRVALGARPAWLLLVAALILALLAAAVWVGSRPRVAAWQRVELPVGGSVHDITAMPSGYLAVGEADGNAAAWTSPDCLHWTPASTPEKEWKQSGTMSAVFPAVPVSSPWAGSRDSVSRARPPCGRPRTAAPGRWSPASRSSTR
ncbi:MAG: hypothetical protein A2X23_11940 [Chloroflexi bacterium GWC2_73_18]|nr:MAG: hypothetical protein A2X23_11940 [Chloroflexi bacterium GWC2_73_18]